MLISGSSNQEYFCSLGFSQVFFDWPGLAVFVLGFLRLPVPLLRHPSVRTGLPFAASMMSSSASSFRSWMEIVSPESMYTAPFAIWLSFPEREAALAAVMSPSGSWRTKSCFNAAYRCSSSSERYTVYLELTSSGIRRWSADFMEIVMSEISLYICCSASGRGL